jgi:hypothetical protein
LWCGDNVDEKIKSKEAKKKRRKKSIDGKRDSL